MKQAYTVINILLASCLILFGCAPARQAAKIDRAQMPAQFAANQDSVSSATIPWKQFFSDKNLIDLVDSALLNNWDLQIALQRIQAAQSNVLLSKGALKPFVNAVVAPGIRKFGDYTMDGAGNKTTEIYNGENVPKHLPDYYAGFQVSWELNAWGKLQNKKKAATARFLSSVAGKNMVATNIVAAIANAYYTLLSLEQTLHIIDETVQLQESALAIVKVQKEAAKANELAVKQFEAQLLNLRSFRFDIVQQIAEAESSINFLAGRYPQQISKDSASFINTSPALLKTGVPANLLQNRPDIQQAAYELMASDADVLAAKALFYPTINISAGIGLQAFRPELLIKPQSIVYNALGNLTAPLLNRSVIKAEFFRADAAQLEALYNYQKAIVNGYVEVYNEMQRLNNLQQSFDIKKKEVDVLTQSIDISNDLFRFGRANYLEVLVTQQAALAAKLTLIEIKKNQLLAGVNLYKALGGGWR